MPELCVIYIGNKEVPNTILLSNDVPIDKDCDLGLLVHILKQDTSSVIGEYVAFTKVADEVRHDKTIEASKKTREVVQHFLERTILSVYMACKSVVRFIFSNS